MQQTLLLTIKAFSINDMYYATVKKKTAKAREWSMNVFHHLNTVKNLEKLNSLRAHFKPKKHQYKVDLIFFFPPEVLTTKADELSSRAFDISNIEKPLIDLLFLPIYYNKEHPTGCKNLKIDDKTITDLSSKKRASPDNNYYIKIKLSIVDRNLTDEDPFKDLDP